MSLNICIIGVYFGPLPNYFPLWLRSCEANRSVNFLLVTDQKLTDLPQNVRVRNMCLEEMSALAKHKLSADITLDTPYKCCDYKPVYGLIFSNELNGVDYWGHCDLDLIFGDLDVFFNKYPLEKYDKYLPLGHLSLYRNDPIVMERFRITPRAGNGWKESFSTSATTQFDECGGINAIYEENNFPFFRDRIFADISKSTRRMKLVEDYPDAHEKNYSHQIFWWQEGQVLRTYWDRGELYTDAFLYIHLKKRLYQPFQFDANTVSGYLITPDQFIPKTDSAPPNLDIIRQWNPYHGKTYERIEKMVLYRIKSKWKAEKNRRGWLG